MAQPTSIYEQEHEDFRAMARTFMEKEVAPHMEQWEKDGQVSRDLWLRAGEQGLLCFDVPEEFGGMGVQDFRYNAIVSEELSRIGASGPGFPVHTDIIVPYITSLGTDEQKQRWLPDIAAGRILGCFGLTEPGHGSDAGNLRTRARRDGDDWVIDGSKVFITNGTWADVALVFARTSDDGPRGVSAFLVPTDTPGFEATEIKGKLGLRGQATAALSFDGVRVPADALLGEVGQGFKIAMQTLDKGRVTIAASCVGIVQGCLEETVAYTGQREQFGQPIADFQNTQFMLADMATELESARALLYLAAAKVTDDAPDKSRFSAMAKRLATDGGSNVVNNALQLFGGYGYLKEYPIERFWRDLRVHSILEGTNQVMRMIVGRDLLRQ